MLNIDTWLERGYFVAGHFNYECGESFVGLATDSLGAKGTDQPLARLGVFSKPVVFHHTTGTITGTLACGLNPNPKSKGRLLRSDGLHISEWDYGKKVERIHSYLQQGDTYQVNLTDRITGVIEAEPLQLYEELLGRQPVPFAAFLNYPGSEILSFSPELFFRIFEGIARVKPMKGTWPRGLDIQEDAIAEEALVSDEKNRSEHIMIVDLLRNDLGQVCEWGSVAVDRLFQAERYATLFQMTSTISGKLRSSTSATKVFKALFPSGSITGAPKRRTMEIIRELEDRRRGPYTGAIGYFAPNGDACFSVAIRTMVLSGEKFTMGVGGGITAGSIAYDEFEECRLKGLFLTQRREPISLIETMRAEGEHIPLLREHMRRLARSADYFGIVYDDTALEEALIQTAHKNKTNNARVRLELSETGSFTIACSPMGVAEWSGKLLLSLERTLSTDTLLRHKTTRRNLYNQERAAANESGFDEVIFLNEEGHLTEGAITNIFLRCGDRWLTPSLNCGVLPGVRRGLLLEEQANTREAVCTLEMLKNADEIIICNALRGVLPVASISTANLETLWVAG